MTAPTGTLPRIHAALAQSDMTARQLGIATNRTPRQVSNAIQSAKRTSGPRYVPIYIGGYLREDGLRQPIYSLTKPAAVSVSRKGIAPRYVPEFRTLTADDYDLRAHMRMAVAGR